MLVVVVSWMFLMFFYPGSDDIDSRWHGAVTRYLCANLTSEEPNNVLSLNEMLLMRILGDSVFTFWL